ncbi:MAG: Coenzyme F420 hydrogenase/dehydrogenase, beta subunit C-terminal domain [Candidatus Methanospirareceae archaeon]
MKGAELKYEDLGGVFKGLLEKGVVDCLVLPQRIGNSVTYTLVKSGDKIEQPAIFTPVFNVNVANALKGWTIKEKVGIVAKPCEIRAVVELIKLTQINNDSVLMISVDCSGTFDNKVYTEHSGEIGDIVDENKIKELEGKGIEIREACKICENKLAEFGDIIIARVDGKVVVGGITEKGINALSLIEGLSLEEKDLERKEEKERIREEARKKKEELPKIDSIEALEEALRNCVVCKNCRDMCPVCYCKECFFEQPLGNPVGGDLLNMAELRGIISVPVNKLFYHLTRIYHVCTTCVGCGACEDACPKDIPLVRIYRIAAEEVQKIFEYEPGRNIEEPLPLVTYKEDELEPR